MADARDTRDRRAEAAARSPPACISRPSSATPSTISATEGFAVDDTVETLLSSDSGVGVAKSVGLGVIGFADAFARLAPDLVVVLGDRYETFAAAQAAMYMRLPMAHLFGGDVTEGAIDESIRHAISKMSHLHFTSNADSTRRLAQLGEDPSRIFTVGSPGIDSIKRLKLMDRETIGREVGMALGERNVLVTFHPGHGRSGPLGRLAR